MIRAAEASGNLLGNIQESTGHPINNLHTSCADSEYTKPNKMEAFTGTGGHLHISAGASQFLCIYFVFI